MVKLGETETKLLDAALKGMQNAYVLWSFPVGAAVLAEDGEIYFGCNIESWVSGLGICAERAAIDHAVMHGCRKIREVAVIISAQHKGAPRPCGVCLQHISDFAEKPQIKLIMAKAEQGKVLFETVQVKTLEELLPFPYKK
jgi:cytidine deaminase